MSKKKDNPRKAGRHRKIDEAMRQQVLGIVGVGGSLHDAADIIGVDYKTLYLERKRNLDFANGVRKALTTGKIRHLQKIGKASQWQSSAWFLERKYGAEYGKKVDFTSGGKPLKQFVNVDFDEV